LFDNRQREFQFDFQLNKRIRASVGGLFVLIVELGPSPLQRVGRVAYRVTVRLQERFHLLAIFDSLAALLSTAAAVAAAN
jgi:hypothetical protein